jgi:hypothetical protein
MSKKPRKSRKKKEPSLEREEIVEGLLDDELEEDESEIRKARKELKDWTHQAKQGQLKTLQLKKESPVAKYSPVKLKPSFMGFNTLDQILNRR